MTEDNRVRPSLLEGMRDLQNLLVHLQSVLHDLGIPIVRSGGGLTFSGFSIQASREAPVDWVGYHIDRPDLIIYQIQDRVLPEDCPLANLKRVQVRRYERTLSLLEDRFFDLEEADQMALLAAFLLETIDYLNSLPPEDDDAPTEPFIPVIDRG